MGFLDNYEDVNARVRRFQEAFPMGRIETSIIDFNFEKGFALVQARVYRDDEATQPAGVDYALEWVGKSPVSKQWWMENASTSAIGRAISLVLPTDNKPTKSDMEKVQRVNTPQAHSTAVDDLWAIKPIEDEGSSVAMGSAIAEITAQLGGELVEEAPVCVHGHMIKKTGTSEKTGKEYFGYTCTEKSRSTQCNAIWYKLSPTGKWVKP